jgi:transposase-like protein
MDGELTHHLGYDKKAVAGNNLALRNISKKWTMLIRDWGLAINQFAIHFDGRINLG